MKVGSLFSGIGGFDLGFEGSGMEVAWQCERDKAARAVLRRHWPGVVIHEDVRDVGIGAGTVDLVCGGFPCQDVSIAGRRAGLAGERSGLWFEFHRVLTEVAPQWVVVENVPGLLSSNRGRDFAIILQGMVKLGYRVCWRVLDSQHFGVPQRRRRVFVVGHLGDGRAAEVLFERASGAGNPPQSGEARQALAASPQGIAGTVSSKWSKGSGGPAGDEIQNLVVDVRTSKMGGAVSMPRVKPNIDHSVNRTHGLNRARVVFHGGTVRRLTPLECERLQGFPDGWTDGQSDSVRYRQLGNAVTVNVAAWLGARILAEGL